MGNPEPNQFAQSGPMSNCVRDSALLLQVLSGPDHRDPSPYMRVDPPDFMAALGQDVKGLRIAWSPDFGYKAVDPDVERATREAVSASSVAANPPAKIFLRRAGSVISRRPSQMPTSKKAVQGTTG